MRILIADDDPVSLQLLASRLKKWDYEIVTATGGADAWQQLQQPDPPTLVILDWMMPDMPGVEICRKVRDRKGGQYTYIILLTSKGRKEDLVEGLDAGADDYLVKPFDPMELRVRLHTGRRILDLQSALLKSLDEVHRAEGALAEAHQREVEVGARIQQTFLLGDPPHGFAGVTVSAFTMASDQIDGDFYDFYQHDSRRLDIVVGDVMGHGVPAALCSAAIKSDLLRAMSHLIAASEGKLPEPDAIVEAVHGEVTRRLISLETFATLCYARFDLSRQRLLLVDCGHTKTVHFHGPTGKCDLIEGDNMPLGSTEAEVYSQESIALEEEDVFFFYSDGLIEAKNDKDELFGVDRLAQLVESRGRLDPDSLIREVHGAVVGFTGSAKFTDDLTCVVVKIDKMGTNRAEKE
ncbi:MAG: SpoIIE family protein phosphatase [Armatimonadota bacterium]|nr:SpoIIE family protein phosphatase [Armatimonadota bacterium]